MKIYIHKGEMGYMMCAQWQGDNDIEYEMKPEWADILARVFGMYQSVQQYLGVIYNERHPRKT